MDEKKSDEIVIHVEDNESYPEFLLKPFRNEFEDDEYDVFYEDRPELAEILSIPRKCKELYQYLDWMSKYEDYVDYLVNKYGSEELVLSMIESGQESIGDDPIPTKPKLAKKRNKILLKRGIFPCRSLYRPDYNYLKACIDLEYQDELSQEVPIEHSMNSEEIDKSMVARIKEIERQERIRSMKSKAGAIDDTYNFVMNYYNGEANARNILKSDDGSRMRPLSEVMEEADALERDGNLPPMSQISMHNGVYVREDQRRQTEIIRELAKSGFNVLAAVKHLDKKSVKLFKSINGLSSEMSDKELKKWEKKRKKKEASAAESNRKLNSILTGNHFKFDDDDALSFSIRDMKRGETYR